MTRQDEEDAKLQGSHLCPGLRLDIQLVGGALGAGVADHDHHGALAGFTVAGHLQP